MKKKEEDKNMNKKFVALICSTLLFAMIPIVAGVGPQTPMRQEPNADGFFGRTYIRGIIFGFKEQGMKKTFTAIFCKYTIIRLFRPPENGFYIFHHLTFYRKFFGYHGMFLIDGIFRGTTFT